MKFLQKVVSAITKAFTGMFGQKVGGFLASIVNAPFNFLLNSFHYIAQGDYKGLLKYWGKVAVQVALMVFVAIIAPYLLGVLFSFLGATLGFIGSFLGAVGGFLANTVPLLGQVLGGALQFAGKFLVQAGNFLSRIGTKLMTQSKQLFHDLREQGLKGIFQSFKDRILEKINPITSYQNTWKSLTRGIHDLASKTGLTRFLGNVMEQVGVQIAIQKIDKSLEKSKMSSFLKTLISTVSTAGIQALGSAVTDDLFPPQQAPVEATRSRAPPTGLSGFFTRVQDALSSVGGLVTDALKDSAGFIKSLFIRGDSSLPPNAEITFSPEGEISFYKPLDGKIDLAYALESLPQGLHRASLDGGDWQFFKFDPQTKFILSQERIGNLESSFVERLRGFADQADLFIDAATNTTIDFFGPVGLSLTSTQIFLGREYAKSLIDTLRFGDQFAAIKSDFLSAQASFQKGDYLDAARSFGSAGLRSFTEVGRFANLLPIFGLATKGIGSLKAATSASRGVTYFDEKVANIVSATRRLGREGNEVFFIPIEDASSLANRNQILRATGNARSVLTAYKRGEPIYALEYPVNFQKARIPDPIRYSGDPNFLSGGRTAVALGESGNEGLLLNRTREFVTDPFKVPKGSVLYKIDKDGRKVIIRRF